MQHLCDSLPALPQTTLVVFSRVLVYNKKYC